MTRHVPPQTVDLAEDFPEERLRALGYLAALNYAQTSPGARQAALEAEGTTLDATRLGIDLLLLRDERVSEQRPPEHVEALTHAWLDVAREARAELGWYLRAPALFKPDHVREVNARAQAAIRHAAYWQTVGAS